MAVDRQGFHIAVIEDQRSILLLHVHNLRQLGHMPHDFYDSNRALSEIESRSLHVDLVLTDMEMGIGSPSGIDVAKRLRVFDLGLPIILASSHSLDDLSDEDRRLFDAGLVKPRITPLQYQDAIQAALISAARRPQP